MDHTLARIASFISMKLTNIIFIICTAALQLFYIVMGYRNFSPLYILLIAFIAPYCISMFFRRSDENAKKAEEEDKSLPFPELRRKHGFNRFTFKGQTYTFVMIVVLHIIWSIRTVEPSLPGFMFALIAPKLSLIVYVGVRLLSWLIFLVIFRFFPTLGWKL